MHLVNDAESALLSKWGHLLEWTSEIFTWTSPGELCRLVEYSSQAEHIVEIGSYHGKSALVMALANPGAEIVCVDNFENPGCEEIFRVNLKTQLESGQVTVHKGTSAMLKKDYRAGLFDFSFIDAGHLEPDVTGDIIAVLPLMRPKGIMSGHDWRPNHPNDGVNVAVRKAFNDRPVIHESIWAVQL